MGGNLGIDFGKQIDVIVGRVDGKRYSHACVIILAFYSIKTLVHSSIRTSCMVTAIYNPGTPLEPPIADLPALFVIS
jgi:hypothetical protein